MSEELNNLQIYKLWLRFNSQNCMKCCKKEKGTIRDRKILKYVWEKFPLISINFKFCILQNVKLRQVRKIFEYFYVAQIPRK